MPPIKNKKNVKFNVLNFSAVLTRGGATSRKYLNGRGRQHCQAEKIEAKEYIKKDMDNNELKSKITLNARIKEKKHS